MKPAVAVLVTASTPPPGRLKAALQRAKRSRLMRALGLLLCALFGAYVTVVGALNLFLLCGGPGRLIAHETPDLKLTLGGAYTLWPGRVHYRDVDIDIHDSSVHLKIAVERGYVDVDLPALFSMRFIGRDVRAYGVTLEGRTQPAGLSPARAATLPELEPPKPPRGVTDPNTLWGVDLRLTEVTTERLWIDELRQTGQLRVDGGFYLQPMRHLEIYPSRVRSSSGDDGSKIGLGDLVLLRAVELDLRVGLGHTDVSGQVLPELLKQLELRGEMGGHVADLEALNPFLGATKAKGGTGPFKLGLALVKGVAQSGTQLNYSTQSFSLTRDKLRGTGALFLTASASTEASALAAHVDLRRLRVTRGAEQVGRVRRLEAKATVSNQLERPRLKQASLDLTRARVSDVSKLRGALPKAIQGAGGALSVNAHATFQGNKLSGRLNTRWKRAELDLGDTAIRGDVWLRAEFDSKPPFRSGKLSLLTLDVKGAELTGAGVSGPAFGVSLRGNDVDVNVKRPGTSGLLRLSLSDTTSLERVAGVEPPALVAGLFGLGDVELLLDTDLNAERQDVRVLRGRSGSAELRGRLHRTASGLNAALLISRGLVSAGVAKNGDDVSISPLAGSSWLEEELRRLDIAAGKH